MLWVYAIFVLSGFSSLLYQVVWQRSLFAIYGINVESVTVIVAAFMLGLGVGSLAGGEASKSAWFERRGRPALLVFSILELGIGAFGWLSLPFFHAVGALTLGLSTVATFGITFCLILFPTTLMGSTLPLLVAYGVRASHNVGRAVGVLYFVNTLGSGLAALATVYFLFGAFGQAGTVRVAAAINLVVSGLAYTQHRRAARMAGAESPGP